MAVINYIKRLFTVIKSCFQILEKNLETGRFFLSFHFSSEIYFNEKSHKNRNLFFMLILMFIIYK